MNSFRNKKICDLCDQSEEDGHANWCPEVTQLSNEAEPTAFTRIDNRLVEQSADNYSNLKELDETEKLFTTSYPINPADLDKFEEGRQYWEGRDFEVKNQNWPDKVFEGKEVITKDLGGGSKEFFAWIAFPLPTPNDRREEKQKQKEKKSDINECKTLWDLFIGFRDGKYWLHDCLNWVNHRKATNEKLIEYIYDFAWHYGRLYHIGDAEKIKAAISEKFQLPEEFLMSNQGVNPERSVATSDQSGNKKPETK